MTYTVGEDAILELQPSIDVVVAALVAGNIGVYTPEELFILIAEAIDEMYLFTPEEVEAIVTKTIAIEEAKFKGWSSPESVVAQIHAAIEEYKAQNPVKENKTFFYAFIIVLAALVAVACIFVYKDYLKPKMDAKKEVTQPEQPQK